jgi:cullin 3
MSKKKIPGLITPAFSNIKDSTFTVLEKGLADIFSNSGKKISFEELYRSCYLLVLNKQGSFLYSQIENIFTLELSRKNISIISDFLFLHDEFSLKLSLIRDVLMYLDKSFIPLHSLKSINELGMGKFKEIILLENIGKIIKYFLEKVDSDRSDYLQDFDDLKKITEIFYAFNVYTVLEEEFLENSRDFYSRQVDTLKASGVAGYVIGVKKRIQEEDERMDKYMRGETRKKILELILLILVKNQRDWIINVCHGSSEARPVIT